MANIILLNLSGDDRIGLSSDFYAVISEVDVRILDIGQSVIHDQVSQGMMLQLPDTQDPEAIKSALKHHAKRLKLKVKIRDVSEAAYSRWVEQQGADRYTLTLLAREVSAEEIARVTQVTAEQGLNIHDIVRLSGRVPLDRPISNEVKSCIEFSVQGEPKNPAQMRASFLKIAAELDVDIAIQRDDAFRRNRRLVCFDMDSTLISTEVIDELAKHAGVGEQVAAITERAMRGELDFTESFTQRMALLEGLSENVLAEIATNLPLMEGAKTLISNLRAYGYKTAILSGGFSYFGNHLKQMLGIDHVYANTLEIVDGKLTGRVIHPVVDAKRKALLLKKIAHEEGLDPQQTIAVGDGANDLLMLSEAGLGIAFRAKPLVRESAKQSLSTHGLDGILYLLGFKEQDIKRAD
ncbi:phosphoserine phosphatase SerB [Arenicella xantha]|uniref:Phosphoserine phosphatase n=1 Tax=Arenicella xantha TaxID=644221 RepID=A0A395JJY1_9GAMM|nr:phosphoserine phosphatase SerB [Arenicella xantha]RBP49202.1 phosphoserine phosphatase [Arenicella xantha]